MWEGVEPSCNSHEIQTIETKQSSNFTAVTVRLHIHILSAVEAYTLASQIIVMPTTIISTPIAATLISSSNSELAFGFLILQSFF